jgi:periplasmic protein TonB
MDAVGAILAEKEKEDFPWALGALLALGLHLAIAGAFLASSLAKPLRLATPRAVAVRILPAGSLRGEAARAAAPEPAKPRIEKPPEEAPPPPSEKAVLLPAKEEKKKKPTPPPPSRATAPRAPDVSLPSSGEGQGSGSAAAPAGAGGSSGIGGAQFDQPDFKYSYYVDRMVLAIATNWFKPTQNVPTNPVVRFRIERDGTVTDPQIERSSGLPFVDRAALRAVIASSPLPPLPTEYAGGYLGVHLIFE